MVEMSSFLSPSYSVLQVDISIVSDASLCGEVGFVEHMVITLLSR